MGLAAANAVLSCTTVAALGVNRRMPPPASPPALRSGRCGGRIDRVLYPCCAGDHPGQVGGNSACTVPAGDVGWVDDVAPRLEAGEGRRVCSVLVVWRLLSLLSSRSKRRRSSPRRFRRQCGSAQVPRPSPAGGERYRRRGRPRRCERFAVGPVTWALSSSGCSCGRCGRACRGRRRTSCAASG